MLQADWSLLHKSMQNALCIAHSSTVSSLNLLTMTGHCIQAPPSCTTIDASGSYVMPGGIDPHTHLSMPFMGTVAADDFFRCALTHSFVAPVSQDHLAEMIKP